MMRRRDVLVFVLLLSLVSFQLPLFAVDVAQGNICGRVYKPDMKNPFEKGEVRFVNADTGEAKTASIGKDGCYCGKGLTIGNYSMSYSDGTTEFLLPDKLLVQNKVVLATCVATGKDNTLVLMQVCKMCKEGFPMWGWIAIGAGGAGGGVAIGKAGGEEPVASPSNP
jgi:hypothetical protein